VHYRVLVHEGNVVTVKGGIMYKPKVSVISRPKPILHCPSALTKLIMHKKWFVIYLVLLTYPKQPFVFVKCAMS